MDKAQEKENAIHAMQQKPYDPENAYFQRRKKRLIRTLPDEHLNTTDIESITRDAEGYKPSVVPNDTMRLAFKKKT
jgi:hypothetical protein